MNFYITAYDYDSNMGKRVGGKTYAHREWASRTLEGLCDERGNSDLGELLVECRLDAGDRAELHRVPDAFAMMRNLQEAGPEAVHRAARSNNYSSLLQVMGAANEYGTRLIDNELLWELGEMGGSSSESAIVRCAVSISAPRCEFWSSQFIPSFLRLDDSLKACVRAAMEHI